MMTQLQEDDVVVVWKLDRLGRSLKELVTLVNRIQGKGAETVNGRLSDKVSIEKVSPIAWQHINFYGRFEFTKSFQPIDIDAIVRELVTRPGTSSPRE